jgi:hypothetical protein
VVVPVELELLWRSVRVRLLASLQLRVVPNQLAPIECSEEPRLISPSDWKVTEFPSVKRHERRIYQLRRPQKHGGKNSDWIFPAGT